MKAKPCAASRWDATQRAALVHGDMVGLVALDLVLGVVFAAMADMALVGYIAGMHFHDVSADMAGFRIPAHVVADLEFPVHAWLSDGVGRASGEV